MCEVGLDDCCVDKYRDCSDKCFGDKSLCTNGTCCSESEKGCNGVCLSPFKFDAHDVCCLIVSVACSINILCCFKNVFSFTIISICSFSERLYARAVYVRLHLPGLRDRKIPKFGGSELVQILRLGVIPERGGEELVQVVSFRV